MNFIIIGNFGILSISGKPDSLVRFVMSIAKLKLKDVIDIEDAKEVRILFANIRIISFGSLLIYLLSFSDAVSLFYS